MNAPGLATIPSASTACADAPDLAAAATANAQLEALIDALQDEGRPPLCWALEHAPYGRIDRLWDGCTRPALLFEVASLARSSGTLVAFCACLRGAFVRPFLPIHLAYEALLAIDAIERWARDPSRPNQAEAAEWGRVATRMIYDPTPLQHTRIWRAIEVANDVIVHGAGPSQGDCVRTVCVVGTLQAIRVSIGPEPRGPCAQYEHARGSVEREFCAIIRANVACPTLAEVVEGAARSRSTTHG